MLQLTLGVRSPLGPLRHGPVTAGLSVVNAAPLTLAPTPPIISSAIAMATSPVTAASTPRLGMRRRRPEVVGSSNPFMLSLPGCGGASKRRHRPCVSVLRRTQATYNAEH